MLMWTYFKLVVWRYWHRVATEDVMQVRLSDFTVQVTRIRVILTTPCVLVYTRITRWVNCLVYVKKLKDLVRITTTFSFTNWKMIQTLHFSWSNNKRAYQKLLYIVYYKDSYHVQRVHSLLPQDYLGLVEFCNVTNWQDPPILRESFVVGWNLLQKDSYINLHSLRSWKIKNTLQFVKISHSIHSKFRWTGIFTGRIVGQYELPESLSGEIYLDFLQNQFPIFIEDGNT